MIVLAGVKQKALEDELSFVLLHNVELSWSLLSTTCTHEYLLTCST